MHPRNGIQAVLSDLDCFFYLIIISRDMTQAALELQSRLRMLMTVSSRDITFGEPLKHLNSPKQHHPRSKRSWI